MSKKKENNTFSLVSGLVLTCVMCSGFWFAWRAINANESYVEAVIFITLALGGLWSIGTFDRVFSRLFKREKTLSSASDDVRR